MKVVVAAGVVAIAGACAATSPSPEPIDWGDAGTLGRDCRFYMGDVTVERPPLSPCEPGLACDFSSLTCAPTTTPTPPTTTTASPAPAP